MIKTFDSVQSFIEYLPNGINWVSEVEQLYEIEMMILNNLDSSYNANKYHLLFYAIVRLLKPDICLEFGILSGFSLLSMGLGVKVNGNGKVFGVDLFEDYPYKHDSFSNVCKNIRQMKLQDICFIYQTDAEDFISNRIKSDVLHVDLSNNGDTFNKYYNYFKETKNLCMIFEGGSHERDNIEWMVKYEYPPIAPNVKKSIYSSADDFFLINAFPSVTIVFKNGVLQSICNQRQIT